MYLLAADIGGTKTKLAIYPHGENPHKPISTHKFRSAAYPTFDLIVEELIQGSEYQFESISMGVAGPILDERVQVTNLPWEIDPIELKRNFGFNEVFLLNDLEAIANAVPILVPTDLIVINPGESEDYGAIAVIAPGTGLGEAFLTWDGSQYRAYPSEGGHADFAPTNPDDQKLLRFMRNQYEHVSYERLCSGLGLPNIYSYLVHTGRYPEPDWLKEELSRSMDPAPVITRAALDPDNPNELCRAALSKFVHILGSEAGNLALKILATGGLYLAGGIPPKILPALMDGNFIDAFARKGRFSKHLRNVPVFLIHNEDSVLMGAANYGLNPMIR